MNKRLTKIPFIDVSLLIYFKKHFTCYSWEKLQRIQKMQKFHIAVIQFKDASKLREHRCQETLTKFSWLSQECLTKTLLSHRKTLVIVV